MLSVRFGHFLDKPLAPIAKRISISPNFLTVTGFVITAIAAVAITFNPRMGGVLILLGGLFDLLDGVVARTNGRETDFGAFLDSVLDRYSDAFLFLAVAWYLWGQKEYTGVLLSLGALVGAFLISYARARAEGIGKDCHTGVLERPERIILISLACLTGFFTPILWVLFILSHVTVIQRIMFVRRQ
jgi:phosphatidylglycerophosphate synthase